MASLVTLQVNTNLSSPWTRLTRKSDGTCVETWLSVEARTDFFLRPAVSANAQSDLLELLCGYVSQLAFVLPDASSPLDLTWGTWMKKLPD